MRQALLISLFLSFGATAMYGEEKWTRYESDHFTLLTTGGKGRSLDLLTRFELVRWYFARRMTVLDPPLKPRIVVFGKAKEYEPFKASENAAAYYTRLPTRDYIVIGPSAGSSEEDERTAVHEYVHLLVRSSKLELPPWLNEGIAEVYSTVMGRGNQTMVGQLIPGHLMQLQGNWLPLAQVFEVGSDSSIYRGRKHSGTFYAAGWATTHMLMLHRDYSAKFPAFFSAVAGGRGSAEALQSVYGLTVKQLEAEVRAYSRASQYTASLEDVRFSLNRLKSEGQPAQASEVKLVYADLNYASRRYAEAERLAREATELETESFEPQEVLGHVSWQNGKREAAGRAFLRALELGSPLPETPMLALSLLPAEERAKQRKALLKKALELHPNDVSVKIEVGYEHLMEKEFEAAFATVASIAKISKKDTRRYFPLRIQAAYFSNRKEDAVRTAEQYQRVVTEELERANAQHWLDFVKRPELAAAQLSTLGSADDETRRLRRRAAQPRDFSGGEGEDRIGTEIGQNQQLFLSAKSITGSFREFVCREGAPPALRLEVEGVSHLFLLERPDSILVNGGGKSIEFTCGEQKEGKTLTLQYDPVSEANRQPWQGRIPVGNILAMQLEE